MTAREYYIKRGREILTCWFYRRNYDSTDWTFRNDRLPVIIKPSKIDSYTEVPVYLGSAQSNNIADIERKSSVVFRDSLSRQVDSVREMAEVPIGFNTKYVILPDNLKIWYGYGFILDDQFKPLLIATVCRKFRRRRSYVGQIVERVKINLSYTIFEDRYRILREFYFKVLLPCTVRIYEWQTYSTFIGPVGNIRINTEVRSNLDDFVIPYGVPSLDADISQEVNLALQHGIPTLDSPIR